MRFYILFTLWVALPFFISALVMFAPLWVSAPAALILGMYWMGTCVALGKESK